MNAATFEKNYATFLFTKDPEHYRSSWLSEFIAFIKAQHITLPFTFSYVGDETNLVPNLTLLENILMDFSPHSLTNEKLNQFEEFLNQKHNIYVKKLYDKLTERDTPAVLATFEMKKLASLIKALISDSEYLFLENPEKHLNENIRILFHKALEVNLEFKQINAFIYADNPEIWKEWCSFTVSRNKHFQFHIESIIVESKEAESIDNIKVAA